MKKRIWELDAARGLALIGMVLIHLHYDVVELYGLWDWNPGWYQLFKNNYGAVFLLISGISAILGSRPVKRGLLVFCCGFLCTGATVGMYLLGFAGKDIIIYFGVLQCLGCCMMLWPLFRRANSALLAIVALAMIVLGLWLRTVGFWRCPGISSPWAFARHGFSPRTISPCFQTWAIFCWVRCWAGRSMPKRKACCPERTRRQRPCSGWAERACSSICSTSPFWPPLSAQLR